MSIITKLYPPILEASLPAFTSVLNIPFQHNALVSTGDYKGFYVQVKKVNGKVVYNGIANYATTTSQVLSIPYNFSTSSEMQSEWYKVQIAYIDTNDNIGYYSSAAVVKYLGSESNFNVSIIKQITDNGIEIYQGVYSHQDIAEKAYSYQFILQDKTNNIIADTGEVLHNVNSSNDTSKESKDNFICNYCLKSTSSSFTNYKLTYKIITVNGYKVSKTIFIEPNYLCLDNISLNVTPFEIRAKLDRENGSVKVITYLRPGVDLPERNLWNGAFVLKRTCNKDNYFKSYVLKTFCLVNATNEDLQNGLVLYEDFTVEAGYRYEYYLQQFNKVKELFNIPRSTMKDGKGILVEFDDSFLYDGIKQLCVKYNPKVSSFKANLQGTKVETIGSKYPFINYNGIINYKEFPISGLISFQMDENELFFKTNIKDRFKRLETNHHKNYVYTDESGIIHDMRYSAAMDNKNEDKYYPLTDLVDQNIRLEKEFKLEVLDYLNNKEPKLFRSSTEGNYCVCTMNSSLTPNDTLGRMLHTFNCTAYEIMSIDDFMDYLMKKIIEENLYDNGIFGTANINNYLVPVKTVTIDNNDSNKGILLYNEFAKQVGIRDADPMSQFTLELVDFPDYYHSYYQTIVVGSTGTYNFMCFNENTYIKKLYFGSRLENGTFDQTHRTSFCNLIFNGLIQYQDLIGELQNYYVNSTFGKEISSNNDLEDGEVEYIPFIEHYQDPSTNDDYCFYYYLQRVECLRIINFNQHDGQIAKYYVGSRAALLLELQELKANNDIDFGAGIYVSSELWEYAIQKLNQYNWGTTSSFGRITNTQFHYNTITYNKTNILQTGNILAENYMNVINSLITDLKMEIAQQTVEITLLPCETKDVLIDENICSLDDIDLSDLNSITKANIVFIYDNSNKDIKYNVYADIGKIQCVEGIEPIIEEGD